MNSETLVRNVTKLYDARRAMRTICRDNYPAKIEPFMRVVGRDGKDGAFKAGLALADELQAKGHDASLVWVFAAIVEVLEPDELTPVIT